MLRLAGGAQAQTLKVVGARQALERLFGNGAGPAFLGVAARLGEGLLLLVEALHQQVVDGRVVVVRLLQQRLKYKNKRGKL